MKLYNIHTTILESMGHVEIIHVDPEGIDQDIPIDDYLDQAYNLTDEIRISRNKDLAFVAVDGSDNVHGAIWNNIERDEDYSESMGEDVWAYDFDVAVKKSSRSAGLNSSRIGIQLIDAAIDDFKSYQSDYGNLYIRVWVVNPKLANWLEYNRGFESSGIGKDGTGIMTYNESRLCEDSPYDRLDDNDQFEDNDTGTCPDCGGELVTCDICTTVGCYSLDDDSCVEYGRDYSIEVCEECGSFVCENCRTDTGSGIVCHGCRPDLRTRF